MKFKDWFVKNMEDKKSPVIETLDTLDHSKTHDNVKKARQIIETLDKKLNENWITCDHCGGSGEDPDDANKNCPECSGEGEIDDGHGGDWYDDDEQAYKPRVAAPKDKKPKEEKKFNAGDDLILVNDKQSSKMPQDAYDFLMTFKTFTVLSINDKGKINLGCRISKNENGVGVEKIYMFSTDRFELKNPPAKTEIAAVSTDEPVA